LNVFTKSQLVLFLNVDSGNYDIGLVLEMTGNSLITGSEFDAMPASCRVEFDENELFLGDCFVEGLFG
jgi:hypothetical protein